MLKRYKIVFNEQIKVKDTEQSSFPKALLFHQCHHFIKMSQVLFFKLMESGKQPLSMIIGLFWKKPQII